MDQVIWITGASSGIGAELAKQYAYRGEHLILSARRMDVLEEIKQHCTQAASVQLLPFDLTEYQAMEGVVAQAVRFHGKIDLLINNGGISQRSLIIESKFEVFEKLMAVDYLGTVALSRALLPYFIKQKQGHYAVVSSVMGKFGSPYRSGYCGAKHALHGFFDVLRMEHQKDGIHVSIVCPGFVKTPIAINAVTGDGSALGEDDTATRKGLNVTRFCSKMIHALDQKRWEVYIGKKEKLGVYLKRISNTLVHHIVIRSKVR